MILNDYFERFGRLIWSRVCRELPFKGTAHPPLGLAQTRAAFRVSPFGRQGSQMRGRDYYFPRMFDTLGACGECVGTRMEAALAYRFRLASAEPVESVNALNPILTYLCRSGACEAQRRL